MKHYYKVSWKNYYESKWHYSKRHFKTSEEAETFLKTKEYDESRTRLHLVK